MTLAVGPKFAELLAIARPTFRKYAAKCHADYLEIVHNQSSYPQGEKFALAELFAAGYREILYLDADCVVMESASDLFQLVPFGIDVAIHDDQPRLPDDRWVAVENARITDSQGWKQIPNTCYNTGVMLVRDRRVFDLPPLPIPRTVNELSKAPQGHFLEQAAINANIHRHGLNVYSLGVEWNDQYWRTRSLPERGSYIYHWSSAGHAVRVAEMTAKANGVESPWPIGDHIATALTSVGITKERVSAWLGRPCNCPERQQKLNDIGAWAAGFANGLFGRAEAEQIVR